MTQQPWGQPGPSPAWQRPAGQTGWGQQPAQWAQPQQYPPPHPYPPAQQYPQSRPPYPPDPRYGWHTVPVRPAGYQQPRRGNPLRLLLLATIAVVALWFMLSALSSAFEDSADGGTDPVPGQQPTASVPQAVPEPDYDPPDIPVPRTYQQARELLEANSLYGQSVPVPANCVLTQVDPTSAGVQELDAHLNNLTACLMVVWQEPVTNAGWQLPRPPVTVYTQPITTACGTAETGNAFYCSGDQRIYYAQDLYRIFPSQVARIPFMVDMVLGHEFAHAIQARTGILISSAAFEQLAEEEGSGDAVWYSRRIEQQADCLSGVFLNAVAEASGIGPQNQQDLQVVAYSIGDDVLSGAEGDHGLGVNRQRWFATGQQSPSVGVCNTFVAPESEVR